ncbi:metal ABC transporter permease [Desulfovibrio ferrophilus]|nr:metal ABC transporter permease [Desulfovibrio ferrophilus]
MIEALSYEFMRNALYAGLLASVVCGVIGTLVVVNRIVFLAGAVAHAAYGGVGLAYFLGWPVLPCTVGFSVAAGGLMAGATAKGMDKADRFIGALWAGGMALGILLLDFTPGYNVDLMSFLFGSIMAVPRADIWMMLALDVLIIVLVLYFYKDFMALSFDREFAATRGIPVLMLHFLMLAMVGASVVMVIRVVGLILVIALLTIPSSIALSRARSLGGMMALSTVLAAVFCMIGLALAYALNLTSGAAIISVAVVGQALDALWRKVAHSGEGEA